MISGYARPEEGQDLPLQDPRLNAFVERYASAVAHLNISRLNGAAQSQGTGFMVSDRLMVTAGHVVAPEPVFPGLNLYGNLDPAQSYATFFFRPGCIRKHGHILDILEVESVEGGQDRDYATLLMDCHGGRRGTPPGRGWAPGAAFGRLYVRLWHFCGQGGQRAVLLGHVNGDRLRVFIRDVARATGPCPHQGVFDDASRCVVFTTDDRSAKWDGASGGPLLDMDGAVRGTYSGTVDEAGDADLGVAFRLDAMARVSPYLRKVVRDQAPRVLGSLFPGARNAPGEFGPEGVAQDWGRVSACNVPYSTGTSRPIGGFSVFYVDERFEHLIHLRAWEDDGALIPNVVHEDVSVLAGICGFGKPGVIGSWYSIGAQHDANPRRHCLMTTRRSVDDQGGEVWHVYQDGLYRWHKYLVLTSDDLRWPSAFTTASTVVTYTRTYEDDDGDWVTEEHAGTSQTPYAIVNSDEWLLSLSWEPTHNRWTTRRLARLTVGRPVEAITTWWSEGGGRTGPGLAIVYVTRSFVGQRELNRLFARGGSGNVGRGTLALPTYAIRVSRTLSLTSADSGSGGDFLWHVLDESGRVCVWMFERRDGGRWALRDLAAEARVGIPRIAEGRFRMQRFGQVDPDSNRFRQHAWTTQDDGNLGHLYYLDGDWHYETVPTVNRATTDEEATQAARRRFAPVHLADGRVVQSGDLFFPSGGLLFVSEDGLLWSAFPDDFDEPWMAPSLRRGRRGVRLRSVSGASGMPLGWTYEPRGDAYPLRPGEHTGERCDGAWETLAGCERRATDFDCEPGCGCATARNACDFAQPDSLEVPASARLLETARQASSAGPELSSGDTNMRTVAHTSTTSNAHSGTVPLGAAGEAARRCNCQGTASTCEPCASRSGPQLSSSANLSSAAGHARHESTEAETSVKRGALRPVAATISRTGSTARLSLGSQPGIRRVESRRVEK